MVELVLTLDTTLGAVDNDGLQELVVLSLLVSLLDSSNGVAALLTLAVDQAVQGEVESVPPLVTVHGVVTANNRSQLANTKLLDGVHQLLHVAGAGLGVGVTTISEEVDVDLGDLVQLGSLEEGVQVLLLGVLIKVELLEHHPFFFFPEDLCI